MKEGDVLICLGTYSVWVTKDKEYVVLSLNSDPKSISIKSDTGSIMNAPTEFFTTKQEVRNDKLKDILK